MKVSELGEFGLIELLADVINGARDPEKAVWKKVLVGSGDDTAAWQGDNSIQLATTDSLVQDTHFNLKLTTWEDLGWKALAVNLSDIAAMGGIPTYALVSLALPSELDTECIANLYHGMAVIASIFDVAVVGGNIAASDKVNITVSLMGSLQRKKPLLRSAAAPGDMVAITGYTGLAAAGLRILKERREQTVESARLLTQSHLKPVPRIEQGQKLLRLGVRAAIDISDGLIADLEHICEASHVGATVNKNLVPIHPALKQHFPSEHESLAMAGGEDYELLFTAPQKIMEQVKKSLECLVTVIGQINKEDSGQVKIVDTTGRTYEWKKIGWEHFKSRI
jgi:thiamine-monophosphate kinase